MCTARICRLTSHTPHVSHQRRTPDRKLVRSTITLSGGAPPKKKARFLQDVDDPLHYPVLLKAVRGNELLQQPIACKPGVVPAGEHQAIARQQ